MFIVNFSAENSLMVWPRIILNSCESRIAANVQWLASTSSPTLLFAWHIGMLNNWIFPFASFLFGVIGTKLKRSSRVNNLFNYCLPFTLGISMFFIYLIVSSSILQLSSFHSYIPYDSRINGRCIFFQVNTAQIYAVWQWLANLRLEYQTFILFILFFNRIFVSIWFDTLLFLSFCGVMVNTSSFDAKDQGSSTTNTIRFMTHMAPSGEGICATCLSLYLDLPEPIV